MNLLHEYFSQPPIHNERGFEPTEVRLLKSMIVAGGGHVKSMTGPSQTA